MIPFDKLLNANLQQISLIVNYLPQVIRQLQLYDWTLQQLLELDLYKMSAFMLYKPAKIPFYPEHPILKQLIHPGLFKHLSLNVLLEVLKNPEAISYLCGQPLLPELPPLLSLSEIEPTLVKFQQLPRVYQRKLEELEAKLKQSHPIETIDSIKQEIIVVQEKIQDLKNYPSLSNILFNEAATLLALYYIKIHIKELLDQYPLLVLDFLRHQEALLRFANPKVDINVNFLTSLPENLRKIFFKYSEQIAELILNNPEQKSALLNDGPEELICRLSSMP